MLKMLLSVIFISIIVSACTNQTQREEISFSSWGSVTETQIIDKVISDFEQKNPEIKVNFMHIPQNYFQKIHLLFAASTPPDVIFINDLYLPVYSDKLMDLSEEFDFSQFYEISTSALSYEGKKLAVPRDISNFVFYYNKDFIKNPKIKNLDEFRRTVSNLSKDGVFGVSYERDVFMAEPYTMTLGFDNGIKYYKELEGKFAPKPSDVGSSTLAQMFLDKKIVFYLSGRWMYPKISETASFPFGVMTFPGTVPANASGWAVSKSTKHKDAALRFVKYLSSKESIDYFTDTGLIVPARIDSSKKLDNSNERVFLEAINKSRPMGADKNFGKTRDRLNRELFK